MGINRDGKKPLFWTIIFFFFETLSHLSTSLRKIEACLRKRVLYFLSSGTLPLSILNAHSQIHLMRSEFAWLSRADRCLVFKWQIARNISAFFRLIIGLRAFRLIMIAILRLDLHVPEILLHFRKNFTKEGEKWYSRPPPSNYMRSMETCSPWAQDFIFFVGKYTMWCLSWGKMLVRSRQMSGVLCFKSNNKYP